MRCVEVVCNCLFVLLCIRQALLQELRLLKTKVDELEGEKSQYERKLKATKVMYILDGISNY